MRILVCMMSARGNVNTIIDYVFPMTEHEIHICLDGTEFAEQAQAGGYEVFIVDYFTVSDDQLRMALEANTDSIKLVQTQICGTGGHPRVVKEVAPHCIYANNHSNATNVAYNGISMLFALAARTVFSDRSVKTGKWQRGLYDFPSYDLRGKTIGFLGLGNIASEASKLLSGLRHHGGKFIGYRRTNKPCDFVDEVYTDMDSFASASDVVFCTLPSTNATRGLVGHEFIRKLGSGLLVNVGRADVVDEKSVFEHLVSKSLLGFATDVFWDEGSHETKTLISAEDMGLKLRPHFKQFIQQQHTGATGIFPFNYDFRINNVVSSPHRADVVGIDSLNDFVVLENNIEALQEGKEVMYRVYGEY
ncbi:hypothetical protein PCE1_003966 [Barthelona sp. PCE]